MIDWGALGMARGSHGEHQGWPQLFPDSGSWGKSQSHSGSWVHGLGLHPGDSLLQKLKVGLRADLGTPWGRRP